jgi:hypothetical protein
MKQIVMVFIIVVLMVTACTPAVTAIPNPATIDSQTETIVAPLESVTSMTNSPEPTDKSSGKVQKTKTPKSKDSHATQAPKSGKDNKEGQISTASNPDLFASEILGRPTDTSITVNVVPAASLDIFYEYGTISGVYNARTSPQAASAGIPLETLINGLLPNTRYYYRLHYGDLAGEEHTFFTQRSPGSTFTFDIQGDSHPERVGKQFNADLYTQILMSASSDRPDFYMTIGDDFSVDTLKNVDAETVAQLYLNQRQWLGLVEAPVFLVNGNHEQASLANLDGTPNNVAVWAQTARNAYFPQPAPDKFYSGDAESIDYIGQLRDYYAFTWGDALFIVIDPYWHSSVTVDNQYGSDTHEKQKRNLWDITLGDAQYQWFMHTLESSTAKFKFVFTHHVNGTGRGGIEIANTYEWGDSTNLAAHRPGWDKTIHQLMVENGVAIFFQGHDHLFAHQELDGVIYQTLPSPGDPNYALNNGEAYLSGDKLPSSGHVRVIVSPEGVTVDYVRSYLDKPDELAFSYIVN